jgi:prephenate dehydratase
VLRVAYLGPAGTHSEEALRASAGEPVDAQPRSTVHETVMAVQQGQVERAVVPIENSLEGGVAATLDVLAGEADWVRIVGEVVHPIHHMLLAREGTQIEAVERVLSHPQATAQCARFLRERLGDAELVAISSTAEAARLVADSERPWAALGSRLAAELYGCAVVAENVEDHPDNSTRFVWLAPLGTEASTGGSRKTSIVFWGFNDVSAGALVTVLRELSDRDLNLTRIESRPRRTLLGHYMFFVDLDGDVADAAVAAALDALGNRVEVLRVLGSYPGGTAEAER